MGLCKAPGSKGPPGRGDLAGGIRARTSVDPARLRSTIGDMANALDTAKEALTSMLEKLGFEFEVEVTGESGHEILNIVSEHSALLIGKNGDRLDDLQYLVNRITKNAHRDAPRYRIDCDGFRAEQEQRVADKARHLAGKVRESGRELWMNPMNSYHRRLVHNALLDEPDIESISEDSNARNKKILIRLK